LLTLVIALIFVFVRTAFTWLEASFARWRAPLLGFAVAGLVRIVAALETSIASGFEPGRGSLAFGTALLFEMGWSSLAFPLLFGWSSVAIT
jgi:hypothetical protein